MTKIILKLIAGAGLILIFSCTEQPRINYDKMNDTTATHHNVSMDTTTMLVAGLPQKFDSIDVLLFPVVAVDLADEGGYGKFRSGSYSDAGIASGYFSQNELSGNFANIVFRDKSGEERKLTDKNIRIAKVTFLNEIFSKTKKAYLLYVVYDSDTNGDNALSRSDLEALYISKTDGTDFKKLSGELRQFYDYNVIEDTKRVYFRTLEDVNKDGMLNNTDKFHYYYIDFSSQDYTLTEFNPLKILQ